MTFIRFVCCSWLILFTISSASSQSSSSSSPSSAGTFSIVAWDSVTGDLGIAARSNLMALGSLLPSLKAGVGGIVMQGNIDASFVSSGILMILQGNSSEQIVASLMKNDSNATKRQEGIIDVHGHSFAYTGSGCTQFAGSSFGSGYAILGYAVKNEGMIKAMSQKFETTKGNLADRLMDALQAGGEEEGSRSAILQVVRDGSGFEGWNERFVDLRVDDDSFPLVRLHTLYSAWKHSYYTDAELRSIAMFNHNKKFDVAQEILQRVVYELNQELREKPDDADVLSTVASTLATNDIDKNRALELAKRAAKLAPDKPNILNTLAECHYQLGQYDEAMAIESQLAAKYPSDDLYLKQLQKFKEAKDKLIR